MATILGQAAMLACLPPVSFAEIVLSPTSTITIEEQGPFDTAQGLLSDLLEKYLLLVLGKQDLSGPGSRVAFIVKARAGAWQELPPEGIERVSDTQAFEIAISASPQATVTITGQTPVAAGYGVMYFLEKHLKVFWAFPGRLGLCLAKSRTVRLREGEERIAPWVVARSMSGLVLRDREHDPARSRPRTGVLARQRAFFLADDFFKSLRLYPQTVHHNLVNVFPVEECRARHPEVFPIQEDGTRFVPQAKGESTRGGKNAYQAWHPCYTNPKTLEIAAAQGKKAFQEGRLFYSLGINDGKLVQCRCPACRRAGWPHAYYQFVSQVAGALETYYPPQMVGVLAYGDVGIPPAGLKLPDNVLVNVAGVRKSLWESIAPALGTYEYIYGAGYVIPNLPLEVIQENVRYYRARNLRMYYAELYPLWAFDAPKAYVISRLLWDPEQDVHAMLRTFCDRAFGAAGEPMARFYEHIASIRKNDVQKGRFTPVWDRAWPFREPLQLVRCPKDLHARLVACLDQAKTRELTTPERQRLAMVEAFTELSEVYYKMYRLKEDVFAGTADPQEAIARSEQLKKRQQAVFAVLEGHPEWFQGSSVGIESLAERPWPTRRIEQQLEAAEATARLRPLEQQAAIIKQRDDSASPIARAWCRLAPRRKQEHPWYKPTQCMPMQAVAQPENRGFRFNTAADVVIRPDEDPRHHGKCKAQWLHAQARDLPVEEGLLYGVRIDVQGHEGMLQVRLHGVLRNGRTSRREDREKLVFAHTYHAFGNQSHATKWIVIDPLRYVETPEREEASKAGPPMNLQLYLLWRPDEPGSYLRGEVCLEQITLGPAKQPSRLSRNRRLDDRPRPASNPSSP